MKNTLVKKIKPLTPQSKCPGTVGTIHFNDYGGHVLSSAQLHLIFWGSDWNNPVTTPSSSSILNATISILHGPYLDGLSQYRITNKAVLHGMSFVTNPEPPAGEFDSGDVASMILNNIGPNLPLPDFSGNDQLIYLVITPPAVYASGVSLGEHSFREMPVGANLHFGWVTTNDGTLECAMTTLSHELVESITDPEANAIQGDPGSCGANSGICEIADACPCTLLLGGGVTVQKYWSQADQACYPTDAIKEGWDHLVKSLPDKAKEWYIEKQFHKETIKDVKDQHVEQLKNLFEVIINPYQQYIDEMKILNARLSELENQIKGQPYIRKEERPDVGKDIAKNKNKKLK
jgi:hypothetical protein